MMVVGCSTGGGQATAVSGEELRLPFALADFSELEK